MAASTLGDILLTPAVEWENFAKKWVELEAKEEESNRDDVDDLTDAIGSWGKVHGSFDDMEEGRFM
jgi:hypothetical protein